jgi:hypothetical protein
MDQNLEHLRLLSIFHYIVGGLSALFACFPCFHLAFGLAILFGAMHGSHGQEGPPAFVGGILIVVAAVLILLGWSVALAIIVAGKFLAGHSRYTYCLVVAAIECLFMPFGTVLGVFTIIVLIRPEVKTLFQEGR